jgi:hypothetical protein
MLDDNYGLGPEPERHTIEWQEWLQTSFGP